MDAAQRIEHLHLEAFWWLLGDAAENAPLTHTWSLGIEEQFYLLFPGILLLLSRRRPGALRSGLLVSAGLGFLACLVGTHIRPIANFYLLPTRGWELLLGASLVAARAPISDTTPLPAFDAKARQLLGGLGLVTILLGFILIDEQSAFPGLVALVPTLGTACLIGSTTDDTGSVGRLLSSRVLTAIGKRSYSLYLWHWPMIVLGRSQTEMAGYPGWIGAIVGCLAGIVLALFAYAGIEQPLRRAGPGRAFRLAAIGLGFLVTGCWCGWEAGRPTVVDPEGVFAQPSFSIPAYDVGPIHQPKPAGVAHPESTTRAPGSVDPWRLGGVIHLNGGDRPKVVVLGSSHALHFSRVIDEICRTKSLPVAFLGATGTSPFFDSKTTVSFPTPAEALEFNELRRKWIREWRPSIVFIADRWDLHPGGRDVFDRNLRAFLREIDPFVEQVVFIAQIPVLDVPQGINPKEFVLWRRQRIGAEHTPLRPNSHDAWRRETTAVAEAAAEDLKKLRVLRADLEFLNPDGSVRYAVGRDFLYADDDHLLDAGGEILRRRFEAALIGIE